MKNFKFSTIIKKMFLMLLFMFFVIFGIVKENILVTKAYNSQENSKIHVNYSLHMQSIGWQEFKNDGEIAGVPDGSLRAEGIKINIVSDDETIKNMKSLISYCAHVQGQGWQEWVSDGEIAGTFGKSLRMEAIKIKLNPEIEKNYDIYYRVCTEKYGWLSWTKNGEVAGTVGMSTQIRGVQIKLYEKNSNEKPYLEGHSSLSKDNIGNLSFQTHVQKIGWMNNVGNKEISGTTGKALRMEAFKAKIENTSKAGLYTGGISYSSHVQYEGWQDWKSDGEISGTTGKALRMEAIKIKLTGELEKYCDIYYRTHIQGYGWLDWSCNGEKSGSEGLSLRAEAIEICIVPKGGTPPGSTERSFIDKSDMPQSFVKDLEISKQTNQAIIVVGNGGSYATLTLHEKVNGLWKEILRTPARVGYNGITNNKYEGDGKTPSGVYSLGQAFGVADNPGAKKNYLKLNNNYYWVDDSNSKYYNKLVNISQVNKDWNSAEHLIDNKTAYKYAININYNTNCIKNKGSAIFLHCSGRGSTAGCVSVPEDVMVNLLRRINNDALIGIYVNSNSMY
ncbi:MAG: L,D-transpeptidase family protein [Clostridium sp.]